MRDTVELLEAIGRDASLRHASSEDLARALEAADASVGLRKLAVHGDDSVLTKELGLLKMQVEHQSQTGGHEGDEYDDEDDGKSDEPDQDPGDSDDSSSR